MAVFFLLSFRRKHIEILEAVRVSKERKASDTAIGKNHKDFQYFSAGEIALVDMWSDLRYYHLVVIFCNILIDFIIQRRNMTL